MTEHIASAYDTVFQPKGWLTEQDRDKVDQAADRLPADYLTDSPDPYYRLFMRLVDRRMVQVVGLTHRDLGDYATYDAYEAGETPKELARNILENDDTYSAIFGEMGVE